MSFTMRLPAITAPTPEGQMAQMRSYLYQMAQELEFAINTLEVGSVEVVPGPTSETVRDQKTLSDLKSLIIKSADIVDAWCEQVEHRFSGKYTAISEFGTFAQTTEDRLNTNDRNITQLLSNTQTLQTQLGVLEEKTSNAYLRSGELYQQDGMPVYGLEIGQSNFENGKPVFCKFARFTAEKLSFYDNNGTEVAYVSDSMLNITGAHISSRLVAGQFDVDFTDGIAFAWIGG